MQEGDNKKENKIIEIISQDVDQKIHVFDSSSSLKAIDEILLHAKQSRASDIHCDPESNRILIRFRIDGRVECAGMVDKSIYEEFISRFKILAGARTDMHIMPQDGRWFGEIDGEKFNFRASFMPTYHGENVVVRILPVTSFKECTFSDLGFNPDISALLERSLCSSTGLILITGPTGSGKTTTLNACLVRKAREPINVITLEDPVEYEIPGVRQVYVRNSHGFSFANGLRSSLRQDPDVIMLGEIRDRETAEVAIHTALTGHLVLSTLHTNSAIETIPRLIDMGIDPYLLASTLKLVIAQRLIRLICRDCDNTGCTSCRGTGFRGRSVIAEACYVDVNIRNKILRRESLSYIDDKQGGRFRMMEDDGMEKVEWGVTTKEEVLRVLRE